MGEGDLAWFIDIVSAPRILPSMEERREGGRKEETKGEREEEKERGRKEEAQNDV